jgi:hypothetical protein
MVAFIINSKRKNTERQTKGGILALSQCTPQYFKKGCQSDRTKDIGHPKTNMRCGYYKYKSNTFSYPELSHISPEIVGSGKL